MNAKYIMGTEERETVDAVRACADAETGARDDAPHRLIGGGGERNFTPNLDRTDLNENFEYFSHFVSNGKGGLLEVPLRRGKSDGAFIDQLTFTINEQTVCKYFTAPILGDHEMICAYSEILIDIFGFGITKKMPYKGKFFYQSCYQLGPDGAEYGKVHYGGQRETILVELNGTGCLAALPGWEVRLHEFLSFAIRPKITRVDIAHDFFNGEYTPEQAMRDHDTGRFDCSNKRPKSECKGTAWRAEDGSGKTFYVGKKGNAKHTRIYEKGRQLGDKDSKWVRFEIEFRSQDMILPLDILLHCGQYLGGAYPVCENLFQVKSQRIEVKSKTFDITFENRIYHAKNQVGRLINFLIAWGWDNDKIIDALKGDDPGKFPRGLDPKIFSCEFAEKIYIQDDLPERRQMAINEDPFLEEFHTEAAIPTPEDVTKKLFGDKYDTTKGYFPRDKSEQHSRDIDYIDRFIANHSSI